MHDSYGQFAFAGKSIAFLVCDFENAFRTDSYEREREREREENEDKAIREKEVETIHLFELPELRDRRAAVE